MHTDSLNDRRLYRQHTEDVRTVQGSPPVYMAIKTVPAAPAKFVFIVWTTEQWDENMLHHEAGYMEL